MHDGAHQLAFDFGGRTSDARRQTDSLFFAALPPPETAVRLAAIAAMLRKTHRLAGRPRPSASLHVSLAGVGEFSRLPHEVVAAAVQAGSMIRAAPFEARFTHAMSFDGRLRPGQRRAIVLRCDQGEDELGHLRHTIGAAMRTVHLSRGLRKGFAPHLTVLYDETSVPATTLPEPITWAVREFVLVHSLVGRGQHIHLGRWQLG